MRILVVEDDLVSAKIIMKKAEILGHDCERVGTGDDAWRKFQDDAEFDVVISGWFQPGLTGPELCQRVRAYKARYTSFILVTASRDHDRQIEGMLAGADGYLTKPIDLHDLHLALLMAERVARLHRMIEAQAAELRRLNQQFYTQGRRDALTNIPNRLQLEEDVAKLHERAMTLGVGYSLAMIDVDHFKWYNDTFGHPAGDEALKQVAAALEKCVRGTDRVYRYGGEEFCVLLDTSDSDHAHAAVMRLKEAVEAIGLEHVPKHEHGVVTISAGVASVQSGANLELPTVFEQADGALYEAKESGRNKVISTIATTPAPESSMLVPS